MRCQMGRMVLKLLLACHPLDPNHILSLSPKNKKCQLSSSDVKFRMITFENCLVALSKEKSYSFDLVCQFVVSCQFFHPVVTHVPPAAAVFHTSGVFQIEVGNRFQFFSLTCSCMKFATNSDGNINLKIKSVLQTCQKSLHFNYCILP